jgi:hypothetical protein
LRGRNAGASCTGADESCLWTLTLKLDAT